MLGRVFWAAPMLVALGGCVSNGQVSGEDAGASKDASAGPCDPLAPHELPVTLGTILGVGRDGAGTLYVADEVAATYTDRVFVSEGTTLWRKRVSGTGQSSDGSGGIDYSLSYENGADSHVLAVRVQSGKTAAMALAPADSRAFVGSPVITENLTVLTPSAIDGMTLRNLPGDVAIEYIADVSDGHVILVTSPVDDFSYQAFRVYYGTPHEMYERMLLDVARTRGGSTTITFRVGSGTYRAEFTTIDVVSPDSGFSSSPGPGTLFTDSGTETLRERVRDPVSIAGYSFVCFTH